MARLSLSGLIAAAPEAALAALFLASWINPFFWGGGTLRYLLLLMLLEFITIHASAFLGIVMFSGLEKYRVPAILGLGVFYTMFVWGISTGFDVTWPLWAFWGLIANRLLNVFLGNVPDGKEQRLIAAGWAVSVAAYVLSIFATVVLPVPRFGLTAAIVARSGLPGEGMWIDEPQRVLAAGFLYYSVQALWDLFSARQQDEAVL